MLKIDMNEIKEYCLIFVSIITSFSPFFKDNIKGYILINILIILCIINVLKNKIQINKKIFLRMYILISIIFLNYILVFIRDSFAGNGYIVIISNVILAFLISISLEKIVFFKKLEKIIFLLTLLSLILFLMSYINPEIIYRNLKKQENYLTYIYLYNQQVNIMNQVLNRNSGIAWEPGAFQVLINIAIAIRIYILKKVNIFILGIYIISILTTKSTTGILIMMTLIIFYLLFNKKNKVKKLLTCSILIILIFNNKTIRNSVIKKLNGTKKEQYSKIIRTGQLITDLNILKKYIFIGQGTTIKKEERKKYYTEYLYRKNLQDNYLIKGRSIQSRISTNSYTGLLASYGLFFSLIIFYIFFENFFKKIPIEVKGLFGVIFFTIISQGLIFSNFILIFIFLNFEKRKLI